jgi:hypothetical protein
MVNLYSLGVFLVNDVCERKVGYLGGAGESAIVPAFQTGFFMNHSIHPLRGPFSSTTRRGSTTTGRWRKFPTIFKIATA